MRHFERGLDEYVRCQNILAVCRKVERKPESKQTICFVVLFVKSGYRAKPGQIQQVTRKIRKCFSNSIDTRPETTYQDTAN